jgi:hypothetical protein
MLRETIFPMIRYNWSVMRALRLAMGIFILVQGWLVSDYLFAFAGGLFSILALLNVGCCSTAGCTTPTGKTNQTNQTNHKTSYEEVV